MLDKRFLADERISWRAKGILAYLLSKPNDWRTREKDLMNRATEGRDAIRTAMKELEEHGYMVKEQQRSGVGTFAPNEYIIVESPSDIEPFTGKPLTVKPSAVKPSTVNPTHTNNDSTEIESTKNDLTNKPTLSKIGKIQEVVDLYNEMKPPAWSICQALNDKRKRAIDSLFSEHGGETLTIFRAALVYVCTSDWWREKDMAIDNLLAKGRVLELAEKAQNLQALSGLSEPDRRITQTAQDIYAAIGGDDAG